MIPTSASDLSFHHHVECCTCAAKMIRSYWPIKIKKNLSNPREALREWAKHFLIFLSFFCSFSIVIYSMFFLYLKKTHTFTSILAWFVCTLTHYFQFDIKSQPSKYLRSKKKTTLLCFVLLSTDNAKGNMRDVCSFFLSIFNAIERIDCRDWWIIFISLKIQIISPAC